MIVEYNVPVSVIAEDNETYVTKTTFMVKDCSQILNPNSECDGFNFNKCPNDKSYCQPFVKGDVIPFQIKIDTTKYSRVFVSIIDSATGEENLSATFTTANGQDSIRNNYLNIFVDTNQAVFDTMTCWYLKIKLYGCILSGEIYDDCITAGQEAGKTLYQAQASCYEEMCEISDQVTSEPFCAVRCERASMVIEGNYPSGYDCDGYYYGPEFVNHQLNLYQPWLRVYGAVEPNGFEFEETFALTNNKTKSKQSEKFRLAITDKLPYYVARQIARCMNSKEFSIDGVVYRIGGKLDKNFDEGSQWIGQEDIFRDCDEIDFTCE